VAILLRVLLFAILAAVAVRAFGRFFAGIAQGAATPPRQRSQGETPVKMVKDPVCGTFVVPGKALSASAAGATVWFCSEACRDEYQRRG
jgi:YHS domain-containing protein